MLSKVFTSEACAKCRLCCNFCRASVWETPALDEAEAKELSARGAPVVRRGEAWTIRLDFKDDAADAVADCPLLDRARGCTLDAGHRPFECRIWPLRLMRDEEGRVFVACYRNCPALDGGNWQRLVDLVKGELAGVLSERARNHPENIRPFHPAYEKIVDLKRDASARVR